MPSYPSFNDEGMPPPPYKWKGKCQFETKFCNKKIIDARNVIDSTSLAGESMPPFDDVGHGTHTASTIAGIFVENANVLGGANGTAVGIAPQAHLAIYKVCNREAKCPEGAIIAAFDIAIEDGVDIISISLGGTPNYFFMIGIAMGSLGATLNGILVISSAGNGGPGYGTLSNDAPWLLSVGASTTDRRIMATAKLENGLEMERQSLFQPKPEDFDSNLLLPLVHFDGEPCYFEALKRENVQGKIVFCVASLHVSGTEQAEAVKNCSGASTILANREAHGYTTTADYKSPLPMTHLSYAAGMKIRDYINSTSMPKATILFKGTVGGDSSAPFSSRGPSNPI